MVEEMVGLASETVKSKDPVDHWMLSWREDEKPDIEQVKEAVEIFLTHLGAADLQVIWALHDDTDHRHVHLEINRVDPITHKVRKFNKGFDRESAMQAIALIEKRQGWKPARNARYTVVDGKPVLRGNKLTPVKPSTKTLAIEVLTGEKQPETIVQEVAGPIIRSAKSWGELHQALAKENMRYERFGSGAIIYIGEIGIKASKADRNGSLAKLVQRFGAFEPAQEIFGNRQFVPSARENAESGNSQRMRHSTGRAPEQAQSADLTWKQYNAALDKHRSGKAAAKAALDARHQSEWAELKATQKRERDTAYALPRDGSRHLYTLLVSQLAREQEPARVALDKRHQMERRKLGDLYPAMPVFKIWLSQPRITGDALLLKEQQKTVSHTILRLCDKRLSEDLWALKVSQDDRHHILYTSSDVVVFKDEGWTVTVLDPDSTEVCGMALALALSKFGPNLVVNGSDEFKWRVVHASVEYRLVTHFRDPALEKMRAAMQRSHDENLIPAASVPTVATVVAKAQEVMSPASLAFPSASEHIGKPYYSVYESTMDQTESSDEEIGESPR